MTVNFVPSPAVALSLAAATLLPALVLALSHGPTRVAAPGRRFVAASIIVWLGWIAAMVAVAPNWIDLVTGALLLATATLVAFTLWTLVAWGFTLSMILALDRAKRTLSIDEWAWAYTCGKSPAAFARDRLGVLFALGLARMRGECVVMTPVRGRLFAHAAGVLRKVFGLPQ